MVCPPRTFAAFACACAAAASIAPLPAHATWLGLSDGDYELVLLCTSSVDIVCPSSFSGTMTVAGSGLSAVDITVDGVDFTGDPADSSGGPPSFVRDTSELTLFPLTSLVLGYVISGGSGSLSAGDRFWSYCANVSAGGCSLGTEGSWVARPSLNAVPAPAPAALLAAALFAGFVVRGRQRPRA